MGVTVLLEDARRLRYCTRGLREGFEKHGLDWGDFLRNGIDSDILLEKSGGDEMVKKWVEVAYGRQQ